MQMNKYYCSLSKLLLRLKFRYYFRQLILCPVALFSKNGKFGKHFLKTSSEIQQENIIGNRNIKIQKLNKYKLN